MVAHATHGAFVLLQAETLERNKQAGRDAQTPIGAATRYLYAAVLFLSGFIWAELRWLWLGLAVFTMLAGCMVLIVAFSPAGRSSTATYGVAEFSIAERARERRLGLLVRAVILVIWVYAWRAYF